VENMGMVIATSRVPDQVTQIKRAELDLFSKDDTVGQENGLTLTESL
jgi:hypothetical protein